MHLKVFLVITVCKSVCLTIYGVHLSSFLPVWVSLQLQVCWGNQSALSLKSVLQNYFPNSYLSLFVFSQEWGFTNFTTLSYRSRMLTIIVGVVSAAEASNRKKASYPCYCWATSLHKAPIWLYKETLLARMWEWDESWPTSDLCVVNVISYLSTHMIMSM